MFDLPFLTQTTKEFVSPPKIEFSLICLLGKSVNHCTIEPLQFFKKSKKQTNLKTYNFFEWKVDSDLSVLAFKFHSIQFIYKSQQQSPQSA